MSSPAFAKLLPPKKGTTGPRTAAGKATSSQNSLKHGLASGTLLLPDEDPAEFAQLLTSLQESHSPTDATESLLVEDMAKFHWLADRAIRLQTEAFAQNDMAKLALFLRYQTTNHRAFHKSLATLLTLRKQTQQFVSQKRAAAKQEATSELYSLLNGPFRQSDIDAFEQKFRQPARSPNSLKGL